MRKISTIGLALSLLLATAPAFAHPGHDLSGAGFVAGLMHPLLGLDHLLAMLVVGVWAAQLGGRARLWVPASFLALMGCGALFAFNGYTPPQVEAGIAASLLALGLLCATAWRLPLQLAMGVVSVFAFFHGAAHGSELPTLAQPAAFSLGFLIATASLHIAGLSFGAVSARHSSWLARACGLGTVAAGLVYSFA
ncbi:MAG: HupE/UreJ family protein [Pseudomonadota bacterium]